MVPAGTYGAVAYLCEMHVTAWTVHDNNVATAAQRTIATQTEEEFVGVPTTWLPG